MAIPAEVIKRYQFENTPLSDELAKLCIPELRRRIYTAITEGEYGEAILHAWALDNALDKEAAITGAARTQTDLRQAEEMKEELKKYGKKDYIVAIVRGAIVSGDMTKAIAGLEVLQINYPVADSWDY